MMGLTLIFRGKGWTPKFYGNDSSSKALERLENEESDESDNSDSGQQDKAVERFREEN